MKFRKKKILFIATVLALPVIAVSCGAKDNTNGNNQNNNNENKTKEAKVKQDSKIKSEGKIDKKETTPESSPKTDKDSDKKSETLTPKVTPSESPTEKENPKVDKKVEKETSQPKESTKPTKPEKEKSVEEPKTTPKQSDEPKESTQPKEEPKDKDKSEETEDPESGVHGTGDDAFNDSDTLDFISNINFSVDNPETKTVNSVTVPEVEIRGYDKTKFEVTILKLTVNPSVNTVLDIQYKVALISDAKQERIKTVSIDGFKKPENNQPVVTKEQRIQNYQKALDIAEKGKLWIPHWRPKKEDFVLVDSSVVFEAIDRSNDKTFNFALSNKYKVSIASDPITTKPVAFLIGLTYEKNNLYFLTDRSIPTSDFQIWSTSPTNPTENIPNSVYLQLNTASKTATIKYKLYNPNAATEADKLSKEFTEIVKY